MKKDKITCIEQIEQLADVEYMFVPMINDGIDPYTVRTYYNSHFYTFRVSKSFWTYLRYKFTDKMINKENIQSLILENRKNKLSKI